MERVWVRLVFGFIRLQSSKIGIFLRPETAERNGRRVSGNGREYI
jgi:hypothetical protein